MMGVRPTGTKAEAEGEETEADALLAVVIGVLVTVELIDD